MIHDNTYDQIHFKYCERRDELMEVWRERKHIEKRFPLYHRWHTVRYWRADK